MMRIIIQWGNLVTSLWYLAEDSVQRQKTEIYIGSQFVIPSPEIFWDEGNKATPENRGQVFKNQESSLK